MKLTQTRLLAALVLALGSTALANTTWYVNGVNGSNNNNCTSVITHVKRSAMPSRLLLLAI